MTMIYLYRLSISIMYTVLTYVNCVHKIVKGVQAHGDRSDYDIRER